MVAAVGAVPTSHAVPVDGRREDGNLLLAGLPPASRRSLQPHLERVSLPSRRVVMEPGEPITDVYFPETGVLSQSVRLADGSAVEVNLVGHEGMAGLAVYLGAGSAPLEVTSLVPGTHLRMRAATLVELSREDRAFLDRLHLYTQVVLSVRACSVGCDRLHPVQARLARWLLKAHDRARVDEFPLTHDVLALMLGVARPSVSVNARALQRVGLIDYRRGHVRILDRTGLERLACECYWTVRQEFGRLLGGSTG